MGGVAIPATWGGCDFCHKGWRRILSRMDTTTDTGRPSPPARAALALISFYKRFISPMLPATCRYVPTCSEYAMIAVQRYGFLRGSWMAIKRICRCHPFHPGGYDPVP